MSEYVQMDMFDIPKNETQLMWENLTRQRLSNDKVRKRLFSELADLREQFIELRAEYDHLIAKLQDSRSVI